MHSRTSYGRTGAALAIILGAFFIAGLASAQNQVKWISQFGTFAVDHVVGISVDGSGVYVAGETDGMFPGETDLGSRDAYIRKLDAAGAVLWTRQFGSAGFDVTRGVFAHSSGIYVSGHTNGALVGSNLGGNDVFLQKYDVNGTLLWTRQFGTDAGDIASKVVANESGVYLLAETAGTFPGQISAGGRDVVLLKFDFDGNEIWTRQFGTPAEDNSRGVALDSSGVYVVGETTAALPGQSSAGGIDGFILKLDFDGNELWTRQFGTFAADHAVAIAADATGVYVVGETDGVFPGETDLAQRDAYIRKFDAAGGDIWARQFGSPGFDVTRGVFAHSSGVYVSGHSSGVLPGQTSAGDNDVYVRKYHANGDLSWTLQIGGSAEDIATGIAVEATGVYAIGETRGSMPGQGPVDGARDAFALKLALDPFEVTGPTGAGTTISGDETGNTVVTVTDETTGQPTAQVILPPGTQVPAGTLTVTCETHGNNNTCETTGVVVPYPPGKSLTVKSNAGSNFVCIVDRPDSVLAVGLPNCGSTDISLSQVVMACPDGPLQFSGFPDAPTTRTYTCTKISGGGTFMRVDGLAFSLVFDGADVDGVVDAEDACPLQNATGFDADRDGCIDTLSGLAEVVNSLVLQGVIAAELQTSLLSKVASAEKSASKENVCAAVNQLGALRNQIEAQRGKKISNEPADLLIDYGNNVIQNFLRQLAGGAC